MKHLDTLFRKMFGREKDTEVSFDEDALWDSIVDDLGPKNSIVSAPNKFGGWIPISIVVGLILAGSIYLTLNSIQSPKLATLLSEETKNSIDKSITAENQQLKETQTDRYLSTQNTEVQSTINSIENEEISNVLNETSTRNPRDGKEVVDLTTNPDHSASNSKKYDAINTKKQIEKSSPITSVATSKTIDVAAKRTSGEALSSMSNSDKLPGSSQAEKNTGDSDSGISITDQTNSSSINNEDESTDLTSQVSVGDKSINKTNVIDGREIERDPAKGESNFSGFRPSNTRLNIFTLEVLKPEYIQTDYQDLTSVSLNENGLQPTSVFQKKHQSWNYKMGIFSGVNLTDVSFQGNPEEVVESKNMTEKIGLGTQIGVNLSAVYKNKWSLTTGLNSTLLHTIYKDKSNTEFVEDQHQIEGIVLSQNNELLDQFSRDSSLTRNIYSADVHNNYYNTITLPVLVGWESSVAAISVGIKAGPQISYRLSQSGRTIDSEGIYGDFDNTNEVMLKPWNVDFAGELWLSIPVTNKLNLRGAYHFRANQNNVFNSTDINASILNHQLRLGISFAL